MTPIYTTHLICAPELDKAGAAATLLVQTGEQVEADTPLVRLHGPDWQLDICAPAAGLIGEIAISIRDRICSNDLLLTMEIEEQPFVLFPMLDTEPAFAPACQLPYCATKPNASHAPLQVLPEAASLAGQLGVDLAEVKPGPDGMLDSEAVTAHVRDILVRWRKLRRLLTD